MDIRPTFDTTQAVFSQVNMSEENEKYLAILFFLKTYNGAFDNLPGVEEDEKELTGVLKKYKKVIVNSSKNILDDLKEIIEGFQQKKFERVHFNFSGHGKDAARSLASNIGSNPFNEEDLLTAQTPIGDCVLGTGVKTHASSIHDIKVELSKMDADKITMTLDCCRTVVRGHEPEVSFAVDYSKKPITSEQQKKIFIVHATMETQPAHDKGRSFTQILSSVCKANGGAVDILKMVEKVNVEMEAAGMKQRCMSLKEEGTGPWERYMWPHQLDKTHAEAHLPVMGGPGPVNINYGKQGMNCTNANNSTFTINN